MHLATHTRSAAYNILSAPSAICHTTNSKRTAPESGPFATQNLAVTLMTGLSAFVILELGKYSSQIYEHNKELVTMADKTANTDTASTVASPVAVTEVVTVVAKTGKAKPKRLSKGERTHRRRLKQAARKSGGAGS